jgi:hypothetical protein
MNALYIPRSEGHAVALELALNLIVVVTVSSAAGAESLVDETLEVGKRLVVEGVRHWSWLKLGCRGRGRTERLLYPAKQTLPENSGFCAL